LEPNWGWEAPLPNVVFLRRMALNLQNVYQRDGDIELATRLAPYMNLLDERASMHESSREMAGGGLAHSAHGVLAIASQKAAAHVITGQ